MIVLKIFLIFLFSASLRFLDNQNGKIFHWKNKISCVTHIIGTFHFPLPRPPLLISLTYFSPISHLFLFGCSSFFEKQVESLLTRGMGDRVTFIRRLPLVPPSWSIDAPMPDPDSGTLRFGLLLNQVRAKSVLDVGPSADNTEESDKFKEFWGSKAELRRFKDGRIVVAVGKKKKKEDKKKKKVQGISFSLSSCHLFSFSLGTS
jgi:hypothetical protein